MICVELILTIETFINVEHCYVIGDRTMENMPKKYCPKHHRRLLPGGRCILCDYTNISVYNCY